MVFGEGAWWLGVVASFVELEEFSWFYGLLSYEF